MKKIVALGAAAALVGALFAGEPVSNPSVVEFTGEASVQWGVDLDAGKTGFKNEEKASFKMKLFDTGDKTTSGDNIWAELKIKVGDDDSVGPNGVNNGTPKWKAAEVDTAKLHIGPVYVGIRKGDTNVGITDFNTAVRSGDPWYHPGRWLAGNNVGIGDADFTHGIVVGLDNTNFAFDVDFRSLDKGQYTDAYAVKAVAGLKDTNEFLPGLKVGAGASYNLSDTYYTGSTAAAAVSASTTKEVKYGKIPATSAQTAGKTYTPYDPDGTTGAEVAAGAPTASEAGTEGWYIETTTVAASAAVQAGKVTKNETKKHNFAYAGNFGYKFKIDDKFYVYPQAGINGKVTIDNTTTDVVKTTTDNTVAAGLLFGWGDTNSYGSSGLLYFDVGDREKGLTPGVGVVAYIPLANVVDTKSSNPTTVIKNNSLQALIVPSFYSGDLIKNFKAGIYSEIGLFNTATKADKVSGTTTEKWEKVANEKDAFAFAIAGSLSYALKLNDDAITVTPKLGARYINEAYNNQKATIQGKVPASGAKDKPFFVDYGIQGVNNKDFLNISGSVDVAGLINNTTFSVTYVSANLLNDTNYGEDKYYNVKAGTLNVGCKIAF